MKKLFQRIQVVNFVYFMAFYIITWIMTYFFMLTFSAERVVNNQQASEIKTALISGFSAIVGYLFGVTHNIKKTMEDKKTGIKPDENETPV